MFCPTCGTVQSKELKFCNKCGANLHAVRQVVATRETSVYGRAETQESQVVRSA